MQDSSLQSAPSASGSPHSPIVRTLRNFGGLGLGLTISRLLAFLAVILLARRLGVASYGHFAFALVLVAYFDRVATLGAEAVGVRAIIENRPQAGRIIGAYLTGRLIISLVLAIGIILLSQWLLDPLDASLISMLSVLLVLRAVDLDWAYTAMERTVVSAAAQVTGHLLMLLIVVFTVHSAGDLQRAALAWIAAAATSVLLLQLNLPKQGIRLRFDGLRDTLSKYGRKSLSVVATNLAGQLLFNTDLLLLGVMLGSVAVGQYAASVTMFGFLTSLIVVFGAGFLPVLTEQIGNPRAFSSTTTHALRLNLALMMPAAIGGAIVSFDFLSAVFGEGYLEGTIVMQILAATLPLTSYRTILRTALYAHGRESVVMRINVIAMVANFVLDVILIPIWGIAGAAIATLLVATFLTLSTAIAARDIFREGRLRSGVVRLVPALSAMILFLVASPWQPGLWLRIAVGASVYLIVLGLTARGWLGGPSSATRPGNQSST